MRADPDEEEFEKRLAGLTKSKVPYGTSRKDAKVGDSAAGVDKGKTKGEVSYKGETVWREFAPARGDLVLNVALAATLVWLPLTAAAIGRCAFVKYRITDRRVIVITDAPWKKDESHIGFHEVSTVKGVSRGFGAWGDMVIALDGGDKLELRSIPDWKAVRDYIQQRRDDIRGRNLSPDELMGMPQARKPSASSKGFS